MRRDKQNNINKVQKELIKQPDLTTKQLQNKTGLVPSTIQSSINYIQEHGSKSKQIKAITNKDKQIIEKGLRIIIKKLNDEERVNQAKIQDIINAIDSSTRRYALFKGDVTDENGGLKVDALQQKLQQLNVYNTPIIDDIKQTKK